VKRSVSEAARDADEFFARRAPVWLALHRISAELKRLSVPFAVAGGLALNFHGYIRMTTDVDLLLTENGLGELESWERLGRKRLRDTVHNVQIDILLAGEYPGDRQPKPVAFPDPSEASEVGADGIPILTLEKLLELKLASGMTAPHRLRDLADVIELIKIRQLPEDYAERLHPYVRAKFLELWPAAQVVEDY